MMYTPLPSSLILVIGGQKKHANLFQGWRPYEHHGNFRAIKKRFSKEKPSLIIAYIANEDDESLCQRVTDFIRNGLSNHDTRIAIVREPGMDIDEVNWMEESHINCCLVDTPEKQAFNLSALNREIETFLHIDNHQLRHQAETDMLICITQFSKENEPLGELLKKFSATLSHLCYGACGFHIKINDDNTGSLRFCDYEHADIINTANNTFGLPELPSYLQKTLSEKSPQIDLVPELIDMRAIENIVSTKIGSYLTFPIVTYGKVNYLLFYLISEHHMDNVSMRQINIINKAFEQLTILLERRQAETSLKKQYRRLKTALLELKTTKQELQTKEKMASIGQMAAGIAHEINNPLSFVISNFSSMDNYLNNIMALQDLQSDFLNSIEQGQNKESETLKKNIIDFEEEQDIPFILEDIRAVVTDSFNGLQRVKNIINDLKSFTYSQSTDLEECHLCNVIEDTLKILKYDINETMTIDTNIGKLPIFFAHDGLMQQVFTNLIKNAAQALQEAGTEDPTITIHAIHDNGTVVISVKDNGPGIPPETQKKIFEPFFTTKKVGEGTGLGLSVTFNIIKKLGGNITLNSQPGEFTEFTMTFPIKEQ